MSTLAPGGARPVRRFLLISSLMLLVGLAFDPGGTGRAFAVMFSETLLDDGTSNGGVEYPATDPAALELFRGGSTDWAALIDATWGPTTWPLVDQLTWFDAVWDTLDRHFPCFQGIDDKHDSLGTAYRNEIVAGVSKGRLAAIFNHLALSLQEPHTKSGISAVNSTTLTPGVPLMVIGGVGDNSHFGAGLTPLADNSLLVYQAVDSHPLGLVPGDIVLGYEGVPWEQQVEELLAAELPIYNSFFWGSAPSSHEHSLLMAAGMNWHLFDTIDVVKYDTGDTLSLSTTPLDGASMDLYCTEQLPIPGVPSTDVPMGRLIARGRVDGTNVGYIYVAAWGGDVESKFLTGVNAFYDAAGLILDFRMNLGGNMHLSNDGLSVLFNQTVPTINFSARCPGGGHLDMCSAGDDSTFYDIPGDPATFYDKPIAVLVGPGAVSSGDQVALRMKFHPHVRVFGKSTAAAFNTPVFDADTGGGPVWLNHALTDAYLLSDPSNHLTHDEFTVDESIWLQPDDVAQGVDTVAEAALAWIQSLVTEGPELVETGAITTLMSYPNPFRSATSIRYSAPGGQAASLSVFDVTGRLVRRFGELRTGPGENVQVWDGRDALGQPVSAGIYFYRLTAAGKIAQEKAMVLR